MTSDAELLRFIRAKAETAKRACKQIATRLEEKERELDQAREAANKAREALRAYLEGLETAAQRAIESDAELVKSANV